MKEWNENLHTNNFHYPFTSAGYDDDVIFYVPNFECVSKMVEFWSLF